MSIIAIIGKPGAGKSYQAVQRVFDGVGMGRHVVTNLPLKADAQCWLDADAADLLSNVKSTSKAEENDREHLGAWAYWAKLTDGEDERRYREMDTPGGKQRVGPLIVVDEAANTLGAIYRLKPRQEAQNRQGRREGATDWESLIEFFRVHRHSLCDIVLLYQSHVQIPGEIKSLIETFWTVENMHAKLGVEAWRMLASTRGYGVSSSSALETKQGPFKKEIFELYDSYSEGAAKGAKGKQTGKGLFKVRSIWMRPVVMLGILAVIALPVGLWMLKTRAESIINPDKEAPAFYANRAGGQSEVIANAGEQSGIPGELAGGSGAPVIPVVNTWTDGLPQSGAVFLGFTTDEIFFPGRRVRLAVDVFPKGWRIVQADQCLLVVLKADQVSEFREFICQEGL